jgi:hypothetical protein
MLPDPGWVGSVEFMGQKGAGLIRRTLVVCLIVAVGGVLLSGCGPAPELRRYPYLTDLVGTSVIVNWATDQSNTTGAAQWGAVNSSDGSCTPSNTVTATRTTIRVGTVNEYQWKALLSLPSAGQYCYRTFLGSTDLLGTDASPRFRTQVPAGSNEPFSFAVFGDWGEVDANGNNPHQANVISRIASSGARFAVSTGDNAYPTGSQQNYGNTQQTGADTSAVFGNPFWRVAGASLPLFAALGNHGLARSDANHPHLVNWPQDRAVSTSGGRQAKDTYCCLNGSASTTMASQWYAFTAGNTRFYVLDAAWSDTNTGTTTDYGMDAAYHWQTNSAQYQWLVNDLNTHPGGLKFAILHYPLYSDALSQHSDTFLSGSNKLEGVLAFGGVKIVFNGHAHQYERNKPQVGPLVSYITGGGGAALGILGNTCSAFDAYAVAKGGACGSAPTPTSESQVFHFLLVSVDGSQVTVRPTDENGNQFDVQTYNF